MLFPVIMSAVRITIMGVGGVGKSALTQRLVNKKFVAKVRHPPPFSNVGTVCTIARPPRQCVAYHCATVWDAVLPAGWRPGWGLTIVAGDVDV